MDVAFPDTRWQLRTHHTVLGARLWRQYLSVRDASDRRERPEAESMMPRLPVLRLVPVAVLAGSSI